MVNTENFLKKHLNIHSFTNCALSIGNMDGEIYNLLLSGNEIKTLSDTQFDIASITKILGTTFPTLLLLDKKELKLDDTLNKFFNCGSDKKDISILQLLIHTSGISGYNIRQFANTPEEAIQHILNKPLVAKPQTQVLYSCPAYILLGKIIENVFGGNLDVVFNKYVKQYFGLKNTCYLPKSDLIVCSNDSISECRIVNDFNARLMNGISGNAGIFSSINDMKIIAQHLSNHLDGYISAQLFDKTVMDYTANLNEGRGLGFLIVDQRYKQTGKLFCDGSYGHCGHTGVSMFIDSKKGFYVVALTNITRFTNNYKTVEKFREDLHNAIKDDIDKI